MWIAIYSIRIAWNPKHIIVQWVGIRTHKRWRASSNKFSSYRENLMIAIFIQKCVNIMAYTSDHQLSDPRTSVSYPQARSCSRSRRWVSRAASGVSFVLRRHLPLAANTVVQHGRLAKWIKWRACDVGEAKEVLEYELWRRWSNGRVGEWAVT